MAAPKGVCFVDTETTGLDPFQHEIWEVALITDEGTANSGFAERVWQLPTYELGHADPAALEVGKFHERRYAEDGLTDLKSFAAAFADLTRGKSLVGANVSFDMLRLDLLLRSCNACPEWHYRPIDIEALTVGFLRGQGIAIPVPWDSTLVSEKFGINRNIYDKHTALGDAKWARDVYRAVMEG